MQYLVSAIYATYIRTERIAACAYTASRRTLDKPIFYFRF
jgi:hypothetical protein